MQHDSSKLRRFLARSDLGSQSQNVIRTQHQVIEGKQHHRVPQDLGVERWLKPYSLFRISSVFHRAWFIHHFLMQEGMIWNKGTHQFPFFRWELKQQIDITLVYLHAKCEAAQEFGTYNLSFLHLHF